MKWNHQLSLTIIASLAVILPMSAFADDQDQSDKKYAKELRHAGKGEKADLHAPAPSAAVSHGGKVRNRSAVNTETRGQGRLSRASIESGTVRQTDVTSQGSQGVTRYARSQGTRTEASSNQQSYARSNHYGGLWIAGDTHSDWNRDGDHHWNHHDYRWYDGGWLIVDSGYSPFGSNGGSTVSNVQIKLTDQGYYRGPIDGDMGPGTRNAIAGYQNDHELRPTGRINAPLLQSLRLE